MEQGPSVTGVTDRDLFVTDSEAHQTADVTGVTGVTHSEGDGGNGAGLTDEQKVRAWMEDQGEEPEDIDAQIERARDDPRVMQGLVRMAQRQEAL